MAAESDATAPLRRVASPPPAGCCAGNPALVPGLLGVVVVRRARRVGGRLLRHHLVRRRRCSCSALLAASRLARGASRRGVPRPVVVALALLAAYAAWSYLSITWAEDQAAGLGRRQPDGDLRARASRCSRSGRSTRAAPGWCCGLLGLGHRRARAGRAAARPTPPPTRSATSSTSASPSRPATSTRTSPCGSSACFPCLYLAAGARLLPPLRGAAALGGAGLLAGLGADGPEPRLAVVDAAGAAALVVPRPRPRARWSSRPRRWRSAALAVSGPVLAVHDEFAAGDPRRPCSSTPPARSCVAAPCWSLVGAGRRRRSTGA